MEFARRPVWLRRSGPSPVRAQSAEEFLSGRVLNEEAVAQAADLALAWARPLSRNAYKAVIAKTMIKRVLLDQFSLNL